MKNKWNFNEFIPLVNYTAIKLQKKIEHIYN